MISPLNTLAFHIWIGSDCYKARGEVLYILHLQKSLHNLLTKIDEIRFIAKQ